MARIVWIVSLIFLVSVCSSQPERTPRIRGYELYSWQDEQCNWIFSLLPNTSSEKTVEMVFDPKKSLRGMNQLQRELAKLPEGERIFWFDRIPSGTGPKAKGSERLSYPELLLVEQIKSYSKARGIGVEILPSGTSKNNRCISEK
jgi:hypothetical protein